MDQTVEVTKDNEPLRNPWAGGLNAVLVYSMDLDRDGKDDLVLFDRSNDRLMTFLNTGMAYEYAPFYEHFFPDNLHNWLVIKDYNCDGYKDIFTSSLFGMSLYRNVGDTKSLAWQKEQETIFTEGSSGQVNLQVSSFDLPGIEDVDGDGDLDILNFNFATGGGVEFHQNMSMERTGKCGVDFKRITRRYGDFEECTCDHYIVGTETCLDGGRVQHSGGKSILIIDWNKDGKNDIVIGQEECDLPGFLTNVGSNNAPIMRQLNFDFPNATQPLRINYPSFFYLDVSFDGIPDLVVSTSIYSSFSTTDYGKSVRIYEQSGGAFIDTGKAFLQSEMIDVGIGASPALIDIDTDGDQDLLVGNRASPAVIWYFENTGNGLRPSFHLINKDYLGLSQEGNKSINLQSYDMDGDGDEDLVVHSVKADVSSIRVFWHNRSKDPFTGENSTILETPVIDAHDQTLFYDLNQNMTPDLLIGRVEGRLSYFENESSLLSPQWKLVTDSLLDIKDNFNAGNLSIAVADFDNNGVLDLMTYDNSQKLTLYPEFMQSVSKVNYLVYDSLLQISYQPSFGQFARLACGPLFDTSSPSVLVGTFQGGIHILRNANDSENLPDSKVSVEVFPNPIKASQHLKLLTNQDATAYLFNMMGMQFESMALTGGKLQEMEVGMLRPGIYIIRVVGEGGSWTSRRIMISN